jgi:hypothetical protein
MQLGYGMFRIGRRDTTVTKWTRNRDQADTEP